MITWTRYSGALGGIALLLALVILDLRTTQAHIVLAVAVLLSVPAVISAYQKGRF
jgi:hypothetical protein